ncbi:MAG: hypothetical protein U1E31_00630 [Rickettsiales bacterium]
MDDISYISKDGIMSNDNTPETASEISRAIVLYTESNFIDIQLANAMINKESNLTPQNNGPNVLMQAVRNTNQIEVIMSVFKNIKKYFNKN